MFKPGDIVYDTRDKNIENIELTILGPEDFRMYDYNRPDENWELVRWESGEEYKSGWSHKNNLQLKEFGGE